ncbi:hypothetical protein Hanom_Chr12g01106591 [Helianthus anomalus]
MPDVSAIGVSLLATHTTVPYDIFLYHIPRYRFLDFPGLKKPSSNISPLETRVALPSLISWFADMVSTAEQPDGSMIKARKNNICTDWSSIDDTA